MGLLTAVGKEGRCGLRALGGDGVGQGKWEKVAV